MQTRIATISLFALLLANTYWGCHCSAQPIEPRPIVIAHRGASGYLPEHTEGAKVLAIAQGADFVEQDVVLSRDHVFVVCHDITLQETTDVAERFPDRKRNDGRFYVADLDWAEIQQLAVIERDRTRASNDGPRRFPGGFHQRLMRLEDELALIHGINQTLQRNVGIYVELKRPTWHREHLKVDMEEMLLAVLTKHGYHDPSTRCFIQCFESESLKHLRHDLKTNLRLIQLMGGTARGTTGSGVPSDESPLWKSMCKEIALYANGVGPAIEMLVERDGDSIRSNGFAEEAHAAGLMIHPYTVRRDRLPTWCSSINELHKILLDDLRVDGFFTDHPDLARAAVDQVHAR